MNDIIEFTLDDGTTAQFIVPGKPKGVTRATSGGKLVEQARSSLAQALAGVKSTLATIKESFQPLDVQETEVKMSITIGSTGKFIIGEVEGQASIEVTVKWQKPD